VPSVLCRDGVGVGGGVTWLVAGRWAGPTAVIVVGVVVEPVEPGAVGAALGMGWMGGVVVVIAGAEPGAIGAVLGMGGWAGWSGSWSSRVPSQGPSGLRSGWVDGRVGRVGSRHEVGHDVSAVEHRGLAREAKIAPGGEQALDERVRRDDHQALGCLVGPAGAS
jgi:hypothetical protein